MEKEIESKLNRFLTGYKDVDRKILSELPDEDILNACKTDKYAREKVCGSFEDENFLS